MSGGGHSAVVCGQGRGDNAAMKKLLRNVLPVLFVFAGCASHDNDKGHSDAAMVSNQTCPVSGEAVDSSSPTVEFDGSKVAFCCEKCVAKFEKMDAGAKEAAFTKVSMKK